MNATPTRNISETFYFGFRKENIGLIAEHCSVSVAFRQVELFKSICIFGIKVKVLQTYCLSCAKLLFILRY
jgi:hypothetical protein